VNTRALLAIPIYNEAERLAELLDRFPRTKDYDIVFVDDGSTDRTPDILTQFDAQIIRHEANRGVGASIRDAIDFARRNNFEFLVIMAGNGKMDPNEVPRLLEPLERGEADYVQGSRNLPGGNSPNLPVMRRLAIYLLTAISNGLLHIKGTDVTCGFRAYRLDIFNDSAINLQQSWLDAYELEYYLHFKVIKKGSRVTEVPVSMTYPVDGKRYSKIRPFSGWWSILRPWLYLTLKIKS
jgi:dolichol-phosphate mannosyltransferase